MHGDGQEPRPETFTAPRVEAVVGTDEGLLGDLSSQFVAVHHAHCLAEHHAAVALHELGKGAGVAAAEYLTDEFFVFHYQGLRFIFKTDEAQDYYTRGALFSPTKLGNVWGVRKKTAGEMSAFFAGNRLDALTTGKLCVTLPDVFPSKHLKDNYSNTNFINSQNNETKCLKDNPKGSLPWLLPTQANASATTR